MKKTALSIPHLIDKLEEFYGKQEPRWPVDPYEFIVWWNCGYPPSDAACTRGWDKLKGEVGVAPRNILGATPAKLASVLKEGGMVPAVRASRLSEIAVRTMEDFGGDLRATLSGQPSEARKALKKFPGIADPGADRILLFAGIMPVAAVPSNCPQVLVRVISGRDEADYSVNYREAKEAISAGVPETFDARMRAFLLLKRHGQEICKRTKPRCAECPVNSNCAFFGSRGRRA